MKIIYIADARIPSREANSVHVMKMCNAFDDNGHDTSLYIIDRRDGIEKSVNDAYKFYDIDNSFKIIRFKKYPFKGKGAVFGLLSSFEAKTQQPDIVYTRKLFVAYVATVIGIPVIFESHAPINETDNDLFSHIALKTLAKNSNLIRLVVITNVLADYYKNKYPEFNDKLLVAPDGAEIIRSDKRFSRGFNNAGELKAGYIGHLYKGKGLEIISALAETCTMVEFHIVGGNERDIQHWKNVIGDRENVIFHGFVPHSEVDKLLLSFDVCLLPNQRNVILHGGRDIGKWTSPLKMFEYMAAGKAILASDILVLKEILQHDKNALLCPPEDIDCWKRSLDYLKSNPSKRLELGENARKDLAKNYTWKERARRVLLYER